jgi:hypothetical protein
MCDRTPGDPYDRSQRVLVFVNAILISVVVNILFFDVMAAPECCVCSRGVCGNRTEEPNGKHTAAGLGRIVASYHRSSTSYQIHEHIRCLCF